MTERFAIRIDHKGYWKDGEKERLEEWIREELNCDKRRKDRKSN